MLENLFSPLNTFFYGLGLGAVFLVLALWSHWKTKREFKRYKSHLSDKLDLDSKQIQDINKERARLNQEAENLRALAETWVKTDPGFAADLFAAADRHELNHGA